jgi:hypothetical protein
LHVFRGCAAPAAPARLLRTRPVGAAFDGSLGLFGTQDPHALGRRRLGTLVIEVRHAIPPEMSLHQARRVDPADDGPR